LRERSRATERCNYDCGPQRARKSNFAC